MMEYEELRERLQTLSQQLAFIEGRLTRRELRLHESMERTKSVQQSANSLAHKFEGIERDLVQAEQGVKKLATAKQTVRKSSLKNKIKQWKQNR